MRASRSLTIAALAALALAGADSGASASGPAAGAGVAAGGTSAAKRCTIRGWTFTGRRGIGCRHAFSVWGNFLDDGRAPRGWACSPVACRKRGTPVRFRATRTLRTPA